MKKLLILYVRFWLILLASVLGGISICVLAYHAAYFVSHFDEVVLGVERHPSMPIGEAMLGVLLGFGGGVFMLVYLLRKNRHHFK